MASQNVKGEGFLCTTLSEGRDLTLFMGFLSFHPRIADDCCHDYFLLIYLYSTFTNTIKNLPVLSFVESG